MRYGNLGISLALLAVVVSQPVLAQSPYGEKNEFSSEWRGKQDNVVGYLSLPKGAQEPVPAIVLVHGSGGIGKREVRYVNEFTKMGIATFAIDRKRIAILGSSKGGSVALETAMLPALHARKGSDDLRFVAQLLCTRDAACSTARQRPPARPFWSWLADGMTTPAVQTARSMWKQSRVPAAKPS